MHPDRLIAGVLIAVAVIGAAFIAAWIWLESRRAHRTETPKPRKTDLAIGFVANFFDTLGVGSFATTTAAWRLRGLVPDELIPGTLNVGHALPTIAQALIFIAAVTVDPVTLLAMIAAAVAGALVGAPVVARLPKRGVQFGMGIALLVAAVLFMLALLGHIPGGGDAIGLAQCAELNWQLRGLAEKRQVPGAKVALQHNLGLGGAAVVTLYRKG